MIQHALNKEQQEQQQHNNINSEYDGVIIKERIETKTTISLSLPGFLRDEIYFDSNNNSNSNSNISNNGTTTTADDGCDCDNDNALYIDWKSEQTNTDNGWMYQVLSTPTPMSEQVLPSTKNKNKNNNNDNNNNPVIVNSPCNNDHSCATKNNNNSVVNNLLFPTYYEESLSQSQSQQRMEHFVWPSDSF